MIKKLVNYQYDCIRQAIKSSSFNNLNGCKDNKIIVFNDDTFNGDDKDINEIMTKYALNKSTMQLLYSNLFIKGEKGRDKFYTPLLYSDARLYRDGDKIHLDIDEDMTLNIGMISNLMDATEEDKIEAIIGQLLDIETCDLLTTMGGLLDLTGMEIIKQKAIILTKMPESTAGLLNELKIISELY